MKLGPVAKLDKSNSARLKNVNDDVISTNSNVIVIFPIYGQLGAMEQSRSRIPDR